MCKTKSITHITNNLSIEARLTRIEQIICTLSEQVEDFVKKVDYLLKRLTITASRSSPSSASIEHEASTEVTPPPSTYVEMRVEPTSALENDERAVRRQQRRRRRRRAERQRQREHHRLLLIARQRPIPYVRYRHQPCHRIEL